MKKYAKVNINILQLSFILISMIFISQASQAQKYITKNGVINFYSDTPMEKIEASNDQVNCALDLETGHMVFKVLMKSFEFEKALMQEHFNENYVESDTYPTATFKGSIVNYKDISFSVPGTYESQIEGELTMHGITNEVNESGEFIIGDDGKITGKSVFNIKLKDYKIKIPNAVVDNISEEIEIRVEVKLSQL